MRYKLLLLVTLITAVSFAQNSIVDQFSQALADVVEHANPAVVTITTERIYHIQNPYQGTPFEDFFKYHGDQPGREQRGQALGSGVIVDSKKGYILTNNHVVEDADEIEIQLIDKRVVMATIVGTDPKSDLAVLQIDADNLTALKLGDSDKLRVGEWVMAVGSPFSANLSHTVTAGIVSALGRSNIIPGSNNYEDFIQTDAAINPGNSGGALLNMRGELVGINTAIATGGYERANRGVGFAIPSNMAGKVMNDLIENGYVIRAWLGVWIQELEDKVARALDLDTREGALISQVAEDSPADKADIKTGDIIVAFNGVPINSPAKLQNVVSSSKPGKKSKVEIIRAGKRKTISVVLEELPQEDNVVATHQTTKNHELGLEVKQLTRSLAEQFDIDRGIDGILITSVERGSPGAKAGLRKGDVVLRVGSTEVTSVKEFRKLATPEKNQIILLLIQRGNNSRYFTIELD
ncbi:MAG: DegQ family serine endoprotease [Candidatus Marinimicrobia bacterium]|nr:DegQ family serine endoprotease [Candidatus Neomarinimicrobiota bacterium]